MFRYLAVITMTALLLRPSSTEAAENPGNTPEASAPAAPPQPGAPVPVPQPPPKTENPPPLPYSPWDGNSAPPNIPPPPRPSETLAPRAEYTRRPIELLPEVGLALPICHLGDNDLACAGVGAGLRADISLLWRVSAYFAWGGDLGYSYLRFQPPARSERSDGGLGGLFFNLLGRVYFTEEGPVEPYIDVGLGGGVLVRSFRATNNIKDASLTPGRDYDETTAGPALRLGGGVDFYLGSRVRLGPSITYTRVFVDKVHRCESSGGGECHDLSADNLGYISALFAFGARVTFLFGDEI